MKLLYTPIGQSDPLRSGHDGPWLHICRQIKPDLCMLFLTNRMCECEDSEHLYTEAMRLMNEHLLAKGEIIQPIRLVFSRHPEITNPDIDDREFYSIFEQDLKKLNEQPKAEIYCNLSSGTPAMRSCLEVLSHFLDFSVRCCYVRNVKKQAENDAKDGITLKSAVTLKEMYRDWQDNADNDPEEPTRLVRMWESGVMPMRVKLISSQLRKLIESFDYSGALELMEQQGTYFPNIDKIKNALTGAVARSRLDLNCAGNYFQQAGLTQLGSLLKLKNDDPLQRCAEMLLTMDIDCKRGDLGNMIRKVTPVHGKRTS